MSEFKLLSNKTLIERLENLVGLEKRTTAEILDYLKEVDRRQGLHYTPASAQRRIDSARLMQSLPEIKEELKSGTLNLTQVSMVAQSLRQSIKESPHTAISLETKKELIKQIKSCDLVESQKRLANSLNLKIKSQEMVRHQRDESLRIEFTLDKQQLKIINRTRELLSHSHPGASWAELITVLAEKFCQKNDPMVKVVAIKVAPTKDAQAKDAQAKSTPTKVVTSEVAQPPAKQSKVTRGEIMATATSETEYAPSQKVGSRKAVSARVKLLIFQRDGSCQWRDGQYGKRCESKFQLQIDHKQSVWAGGSNDPGNLQLLCATHNRLKYRREAGIDPAR